jgi:hypothetical protein
MFADTRTGPVLLLTHLLSLGAALALLLVLVGAGRLLRERLVAEAAERPAAWRWPVDASLGAALLSTVLLAAGTLGVMHRPVVVALTVALALLARRGVRATAAELAGLARAAWGAPPVERVAALAATAVVVLLALGALAPPTEWDSLMYHLRIPAWLLDQGRLATPPDSFHVALVGAWHFTTLPLLALGFVDGPALLHVASLALVLAGIHALAARCGLTARWGWLAVAIVLGSGVFALSAITARIGVAMTLAAVAAHLALLEVRAGGNGRDLALAAILAGFAVAVKPQAGAYALALVPLGLLAARSVPRALAGAGIAFAVAVPWYAKNQVLVGAPLYPKGAPGWFEPWLAEVFGTRVRPPTLDTSILEALPDARDPFDLLDAFFDPAGLSIEGEGAFYAPSPALLLLPLLLLLGWRTRRSALGLAFVGLAYLAILIIPFQRINLRYLLPAVPALAVATVAGIERLVAVAPAALRRSLVVVVVLLALLPLPGVLRARFLGGGAVLLRHAAGLASAQDVWRRHPEGTGRAFGPVIANVHRLVPPDGKVLMLWEARGFPIEREVLVDVMLSNWSFLAQSPALEGCLAGTGITHILAGVGSVDYYIGRGADPSVFHLDAWGPFRDRCLAPHATVGPGFELFPLRAPRDPAASAPPPTP